MAVCQAHYAAPFHACCSWCRAPQGTKGNHCCGAVYNTSSLSIFRTKALSDTNRASRRVLAPFPINRLPVGSDGSQLGVSIVEEQDGDSAGLPHDFRVLETVCNEEQNEAAAPSSYAVKDSSGHESKIGSNGGRRSFDVQALIAPTLAGTKVCSSCHEEKVVGDFRESITSPDGRSFQCRACYAEDLCTRRGRDFPQAEMEGRLCTACLRFKPARDFFIYRGKLEPRCRSCKRQIELSTRQDKVMVHEKECSLCHQTKPASMFSPLRKASGGLLSWCKECNALRRREKYKERPLVPGPQVERKRCACCKVVKHEKNFHRWHKGPDGLQGYCKACKEKLRTGRPARKADSEGKESDDWQWQR